MKQPILYSVMIFGLMLLTACSFIANANDRTEEKPSETSNFYEVTMETEIIEYKEYHITIHYPQTSNNQIDQTIVDYVNQQKAYFKQKSYKSIQNAATDQSHHELHIDFEVVHQDQRFFVVRFIETMDIGLSKVITAQTVMNFDKKKGKPLALEEIFNDDVYYADRLQELAKQKLEGILEEGDGSLKASFLDKPEPHQQIALVGEGLLLYIDSPDQSIPEKVLLERDMITDLMRSKYAEALGKSLPVDKEIMSSNTDAKSWSSVDSIDGREFDQDKKVALTFDDGPHPKVTGNILDVLDEYGAKATFFMIGKRVSYYPDVARDVARRGHEVGNHTWDHPRLKRLTSEQVDHQISSTQRIIEQVTGEHTDLIRLPFGEKPPMTYSEPLEAVPWSIYSEDWNAQTPEEITQDIMSRIDDGEIILLHDLQNSTVETVELILQNLTLEGYRFVTVSELEK